MKLPRDLSGSEVARLLERHYGYRVARTKGLADGDVQFASDSAALLGGRISPP